MCGAPGAGESGDFLEKMKDRSIWKMKEFYNDCSIYSENDL